MTRNPTIPYSQMLEWMQEILAEYSESITLRQLYYQLVPRQKIGDNDGYYKKTSRDLTTARKNGDNDPSKIEDRGRESSDGDYWRDLTGEEFIQVSIRSLSRKYLDYDFPRWVGQKNYVEIWCEKDALGSYSWSISSSRAPGTNYRIRVTSISQPTISGTSSDFTITA